MATPFDTPTIGRRRLLQVGGLTVTLGALVAACGSEEEGEPGRVGYAPPVSPLPTLEVNDVVYLRTATSIELTILEVYATMTDSGELSDQAQALVDRLVEGHETTVVATTELTTANGGEPYECPNAWYQERVLGPIVARITGDDAADIPPSDDPERDWLVLANGLESMAQAMYQQFVELVSQIELRASMMELGTLSTRHAAAVAILATGAPEAYASPELFGEEVAPDEDGLLPIFAIPHLFGSLAAIPITVGAPSSAGTRFSSILETPAANSYIYQETSCDA